MATLDVIRQLTLRAKAEGFAEAQRSVASLGEAYDTSARKQLSVERALATLQRRYDQEFRAQEELAKVARTLDMARTQGLITQQRQAQLMGEAEKRFRVANDNTVAYTRSVGLSRFELVNLSRQIQDVGVSLASGQPIWNVAIQQGTQIADIFASGTVTMKGFGQQLAALITPGRAIVLGFGAITAAAGGLYLLLRKEGASAEETIKAQADIVSVLSTAYKDAAKSAGEFYQQSKLITQLQAQQNLVALQRQLEAATAAAGKALTRPTALPAGELPLPFGVQAIENAQVGASAYRELNRAIEDFIATSRTFQDVQNFRDAVAAIGVAAQATNPALAEAAAEMLRTTQQAGALALGVQKAEASLRLLSGTATEADRKLLGLAEARRASINAYDQFIAKTTDSIEELKLEIKTLGDEGEALLKLRLQHEALRAAKQAGVALDRARVDAMANEVAALTLQLRKMKELQSTADQAAKSISDNFGSALIDVALGAKTMGEAFDALAKSVTRSIAEMVLRIAVLEQLERGLRSILRPGASLLASSFAPAAIAHGGGLVGSTPFPVRLVDPVMMVNAPRLHDGLRADEMFAILQKGERVIPKGGAGGVNFEFRQEIINNSSARVSTRNEDDGRGGRKSVIVIDEMVAGALGRPGSRSQQAATRAVRGGPVRT